MLDRNDSRATRSTQRGEPAVAEVDGVAVDVGPQPEARWRGGVLGDRNRSGPLTSVHNGDGDTPRPRLSDPEKPRLPPDQAQAGRVSISPTVVRIELTGRRNAAYSTEGSMSMRSITVTMWITLDGVAQGLGRPDEDTRGGFTHGGWGQRYNDEVMDHEMAKGMAQPGDMVFGRRTWQDFLTAWARSTDGNPVTTHL